MVTCVQKKLFQCAVFKVKPIISSRRENPARGLNRTLIRMSIGTVKWESRTEHIQVLWNACLTKNSRTIVKSWNERRFIKVIKQLVWHNLLTALSRFTFVADDDNVSVIWNRPRGSRSPTSFSFYPCSDMMGNTVSLNSVISDLFLKKKKNLILIVSCYNLLSTVPFFVRSMQAPSCLGLAGVLGMILWWSHQWLRSLIESAFVLSSRHLPLEYSISSVEWGRGGPLGGTKAPLLYPIVCLEL